MSDDLVCLFLTFVSHGTHLLTLSHSLTYPGCTATSAHFTAEFWDPDEESPPFLLLFFLVPGTQVFLHLDLLSHFDGAELIIFFFKIEQRYLLMFCSSEKSLFFFHIYIIVVHGKAHGLPIPESLDKS